MNISNLLVTTDAWHQRIDFMEFLESHLPKLRQNPSRVTYDADAHRGQKYCGDFYGLLESFRVPYDQHYAIMRMNGFRNPTEYDGRPMVVQSPIVEDVAMLKNIFRTTTQ